MRNRTSDLSALWYSTSEPQRLNGERDLSRSSYDTRLSNAEVSLLKKGLNFAVTPANIQEKFWVPMRNRTSDLSALWYSTSEPQRLNGERDLSRSSYDTRLSNAEVSLLKKGLNFAVTPANIQATEIIANFESAVRPQNAEQADNVRGAVNDILTALKKTTRSWSSNWGSC